MRRGCHLEGFNPLHSPTNMPFARGTLQHHLQNEITSNTASAPRRDLGGFDITSNISTNREHLADEVWAWRTAFGVLGRNERC